MKTTPLCLFACAASVLAAEPPQPKFRAQDIDKAIEIGYGLAITDVDGDKKPDIVLADKSTVQWYKNPTWTKHVIAEKLTVDDNVCVAATDLDGDGRCEIAVGAGWKPSDTVNSGAVFYLIPPKDRTQKWEPVKLHHEPTVHRMHWVKNPAGKIDLIVKPLHGKGNKGGEGEGGKVLAYTVPANPKDTWKTGVVSDFMHMTHNFQPINWDADPEQELIIGGKEGVWWFGRSTGSWKKRQLTDQPTGEVRDGKLPGGGRFIATIEPMHGTTAAVYTEAANRRSLWPRHVLDDKLKDGHAVAVADLLGVGYDQVVVGWRGMNPKGVPGIKVFTPLDKDGKQWRSTEISAEEVDVEDLKVADLNGDNKPDIIAAPRGKKSLRILWNESGK
ncbi:MAG: FG-GAP and VCBS repeat-containing protein [Verrucomicrobiota bacterium]